MVRLLVSDVIRRMRWMYLWIFPIVLTLWGIAAASDDPRAVGLRLSLMLAYGMGPLAAISAINLRELRVLPVTSREIWMATLVTSTLVMPAFLLVVECLAVGGVQIVTGSASVTIETLLLSALYAFAYSGAMLPVGPLLGYASHNAGSRRPRWLWAAVTMVCLLIFMGGLGFPWLFAASLPIALDQFTLPTTAALVACLAISGATWAWTPKRGSIVRPNQAAQHARPSMTAWSVGRFADRFTGIARIAWPHAALTVFVSAIAIAGFVAYWAAFESRTLYEFMRQNALLPFDTSFRIDPGVFGGMWLMFAFMFIGAASPWTSMARQLKTAPLSTHAINGLFLATPLVTWALVWLVLLATHITVIGSVPHTLRPDAIVLFVGLSALANVMVLRYHGLSIVWVIGFIGGASSGLERSLRNVPPEWAQITFVVGGLAAFGLAWFVNHRTLTRSTSSSNTYRPALGKFGISGPGVQR